MRMSVDERGDLGKAEAVSSVDHMRFEVNGK